MNRIRLIYISVTQVDTAVLFSTAVTLAAFIPLFTMQGVEGQIFNPMARTYGYALCRRLAGDFHDLARAGVISHPGARSGS